MFLPTNITLKFGDSGDFVSELQRRLSLIHCFNADAINGFYDGLTVNGVLQFQTMSGIHADGVAGPETLRRLNGAISGDYSGGTDHKAAEEEERKRQEQLAYQQQVLLQQQLAEQQMLEQQRQAEATFQQRAAVQPAESYVQPTTAQPAAQAYTAQTPAPQPAPAAPTASEMLAQMLMAQPQENAPQAAPQAQQHIRPQMASAQQAQPIPPANQPPQPYAPQTQPQAYEPSPQTAAPEQAAQAQPKGMVGRAMQYANEMVQKLANYFESKLPNHVIAEVKQIGHAMANNGVKEVPIPQGPEQQRERGVEQQRGVQQGRQVG